MKRKELYTSCYRQDLIVPLFIYRHIGISLSFPSPFIPVSILMKLFLILQICQLLQIAFGQVKNCYDWDGVVILDYPCDPSAKVSACCGIGSRCVTNLFCIANGGAQVVGTCTDNSSFVLNKSSTALDYEAFKYSLNTTSCPDKTICPGPQNQFCCDAKKGKREIDFGNNAIIPEGIKDLSSYYEAAGYTIPSRTAESSTSKSRSSMSSFSTAFLLLPSTRDIDPSISLPASLSRPSSISSGGRDQPPDGLGLTASAKAIVGAAVSIVGILLLVSCLYYLRRRRTKYRAVNPIRSIEPENAECSQVVEMPRDLGELQGLPVGVEMDENTPSNGAAELAVYRG